MYTVNNIMYHVHCTEIMALFEVFAVGLCVLVTKGVSDH